MSESSEPGPVCWQSHKELGLKYNKIFSDYQNLLAKYNGVFEWAYKQRLDSYDDAEDLKDCYEESLK